jgi:hypothetical protein
MEGQVFDLRVGAQIGPWSAGIHPGLVVSRSLSGRDCPVVVVPLTGTKPPVARNTHVELLDVYGSLNGPMWILCEYPVTLSANEFHNISPRGTLPLALRALVRHKLGWYFQVPPGSTT